MYENEEENFRLPDFTEIKCLPTEIVVGYFYRKAKSFEEGYEDHLIIDIEKINSYYSPCFTKNCSVQTKTERKLVSDVKIGDKICILSK